jgi:hypothetical protein
MQAIYETAMRPIEDQTNPFQVKRKGFKTGHLKCWFSFDQIGWLSAQEFSQWTGFRLLINFASDSHILQGLEGRVAQENRGQIDCCSGNIYRFADTQWFMRLQSETEHQAASITAGMFGRTPWPVASLHRLKCLWCSL